MREQPFRNRAANGSFPVTSGQPLRAAPADSTAARTLGEACRIYLLHGSKRAQRDTAAIRGG